MAVAEAEAVEVEVAVAVSLPVAAVEAFLPSPPVCNSRNLTRRTRRGPRQADKATTLFSYYRSSFWNLVLLPTRS